MSYKRTLIFFIVFATLAAFFYAYEVRGGKSRREAKEKAERLFSFKSKDVTKIALKKRGDAIVAEKENDAWRIREPVSAAAEKGAIDRIVDALAELKYERDIGPQADLQPFGLDEPEMEVEISGPHGNLGKLLVGKSTPDGDKFYVKLPGKKPVFTVKKSARTELDRRLFDLRDKKLLDFSTPDLRGFSFTHNGRSLAFEKHPDKEWTMTSPEEHAADSAVVRRFLDSIRFARIKKFVEEDAADLEKYGLESPSARIELKIGEKPAVISFGNKTGSGDSYTVFASRDEGHQVFELGSKILDSLSADPDEWREKSLFKFRRADVVRLQIESPAGNLMVERSAEDEEEWRLTEPKPAVADEGEVADLVSALLNARAIRFLKGDERQMAERAFEKPHAQVSVWQKDSETSLTLSLSKSEEKPDVYARTGQLGEIVTVDERLLERLSAGPHKLRDRSAIRFKAADIEKIEIVKGGKSFAIKRDGVKWNTPRTLEMEAYEVDRFLWDLRGWKYSTIGPKEENGSYGFDSPTLTVRLWSAETDDELRLVVGKKIPERNAYYLLGSDEDRVMEADEAPISEWLEKF